MADNDTPAGGTATQTQPEAKPVEKTKAAKPKRRELPPYNVVLLDDDDHSYEYVIDMLGSVFGYGTDQSYQMAKEVDGSGRVIVMTTHKERAELKRDQILGFGRDLRIARCSGSMGAVIEAAPQ